MAGGAWRGDRRGDRRSRDRLRGAPPHLAAFGGLPLGGEAFGFLLSCWSRVAIDRKVGLVLELLERDGLDDNTVVIFMGDHGRAMVRGKQWPYDSGLHVPLIIRGAPELEAGCTKSTAIRASR